MDPQPDRPNLVSSDYAATDLRALADAIDERFPETGAAAWVVGMWSSDTGFENDVFALHPYYMGDCTCGWDAREAAFDGTNPHLPDCYQHKAAAVRYDADEQENADGLTAGQRLAREHGLPVIGWGLHCTCGASDRYAAWAVANPHPLSCPEVRPNFLHKPTGTKVSWYKRVGRGMEVDRVSLPAWRALVTDCHDSLAPNAAGPGKGSPEAPTCEWGRGIWTVDDRDPCVDPVHGRARVRDPEGLLNVGIGKEGAVVEVCRRHFQSLADGQRRG